MKKWILIPIGVLLGLILAVLAVGAMLPREHEVARSIMIHQPAESIWKTITNYPESPAWRPDVASVEALPDRHGHLVWREVDKHGKGVAYETLQSVAPKKLERRIAEQGLPYGGTWTFELIPVQEGTLVKITERGYVDNPIFRFVSTLLIGKTKFMDTYLKALGEKFGEKVDPETSEAQS